MNLYVIRHGEVEINKKHQINGRNNSTLTEKGIKQAKEASEKIENLNLDLVICSPLKRTKQTCEYLNIKNTPIIYDELIIERDTGNKMYKGIDILDYLIWYDTTKEIVYENSEGFKSVLSRVEKLINKIKQDYKDKNILIITHGDICAGIYAYLNNIKEQKKISEYNHNNCEIKMYKI